MPKDPEEARHPHGRSDEEEGHVGAQVLSEATGEGRDGRQLEWQLRSLDHHPLQAYAREAHRKGDTCPRTNALLPPSDCRPFPLFPAPQPLDWTLLPAQDAYNEHASYLLGEPLVVPESNRVTFAVSSDNLLLNAYRQTRFGLPSYLAVDTTHRLISEGHCIMPVGTMSATQHFHKIAYGVCSHEDIEAHEHVLRQVRDAVNEVVARYHREKKRV